MSNMELSCAVAVGRNARSASDTDLQNAHRAIDVWCTEVRNGVTGRLQGIVSVENAQMLKRMLVLEMDRRKVPHKAVRPGRIKFDCPKKEAA